jgi:glycosyltransferase involved in cell wall biosynthesis
MKPIKICFVTREYAHESMGKTGGIGVFLKQFTNELKTHNFNITVFSFGAEPVRFNDVGVNVVKIRDLSGFNEWFKEPFRKYKVPGYITLKIFLEYINRFYISLYLSVFVWRHKFDLIEFHDYGGDAPYFMSSKPKIIRCHGSALTLHQFMGYVNRISDSIFEKQVFKRFYKHVVAVSKTSAEITQKAFNLKTLPKVIYNGVTVPETGLPIHYLEAPTEKYSVFYFGSIRERKGIDIACKVFNSIIEDFPNATFHVMGNNNNDYWNTHAKLVLTEKALKHTTYYGAIPNDKVNNFLKKAHVVLFPSFGENFSVGLLEVMALGKLVVTSNIPAFQEIISHEHNGFIVNKETDYCNYIVSIFNKSFDVNKVSEHAMQTVKNQFKIDTIIQQNINYYKSLL